jgi:hypothetical protein
MCVVKFYVCKNLHRSSEKIGPRFVAIMAFVAFVVQARHLSDRLARGAGLQLSIHQLHVDTRQSS